MLGHPENSWDFFVTAAWRRLLKTNDDFRRGEQTAFFDAIFIKIRLQYSISNLLFTAIQQPWVDDQLIDPFACCSCANLDVQVVWLFWGELQIVPLLFG